MTQVPITIRITPGQKFHKGWSLSSRKESRVPAKGAVAKRAYVRVDPRWRMARMTR